MKNIFIILVLAISLSGCSTTDDCVNGDFIETRHLEQMGCNDTRFSLYVPQLEGNSFRVFTTPSSVQNEVQGMCNLNSIDFSRYDLLIGQVWVESNNQKINYVYIEKCNGRKELTVELYQNRGGKAQFITYHAIIPKVYGSIPEVTTKIIVP